MARPGGRTRLGVAAAAHARKLRLMQAWLGQSGSLVWMAGGAAGIRDDGTEARRVVVAERTVLGEVALAPAAGGVDPGLAVTDLAQTAARRRRIDEAAGNRPARSLEVDGMHAAAPPDRVANQIRIRRAVHGVALETPPALSCRAEGARRRRMRLHRGLVVVGAAGRGGAMLAAERVWTPIFVTDDTIHECGVIARSGCQLRLPEMAAGADARISHIVGPCRGRAHHGHHDAPHLQHSVPIPHTRVTSPAASSGARRSRGPCCRSFDCEVLHLYFPIYFPRLTFLPDRLSFLRRRTALFRFAGMQLH